MSAAGATHTSLRILARPHLAGSLPATASSPSATSDAPRSSRGKFVRRASSSSPSVMEEALNAPSSSLAIESVAYQEGTFSVSGRLLSSAPPALVYEVLTDYSSLPAVFHNVDECTVRWTDDGDKSLMQTCSWRFLIFCGSFVTELEVDEEPETRKLAFSLLQSAFMRKFVGCWHVVDNVDGGSDIYHSLTVQPAVSPPQSIGDIAKRIFVSQVESLLIDLDMELQRRASGITLSR